MLHMLQFKLHCVQYVSFCFKLSSGTAKTKGNTCMCTVTLGIITHAFLYTKVDRH